MSELLQSVDPTVRVALVALAVLIGVWLGLWFARVRRRFLVARSRWRGTRGARVAEAILRRAGYVVLEREVSANIELLVDGLPVTYPVRADALVARGRDVFVAEFKGGETSARLSHRATRRQLLEYAHAFSVDSVLLVDAYRRRIHEVAFASVPAGRNALLDGR